MLILINKGDHLLPIFKLGLDLPIYWRNLNQQCIASERSSEKWKASVSNASSYSTALGKVKCPNKFPIERLVRSDALNMRRTRASHAQGQGNTPWMMAAQKGFMSGTTRQLPLRPEEEGGCGTALSYAQSWSSPWAELSVTELSAVHVWSTTKSGLWRIWHTFPMVVAYVTPGDFWREVLHWKPEGEGRWKCCRWHSGPSWMAVVAMQLSWGRECSCAGGTAPWEPGLANVPDKRHFLSSAGKTEEQFIATGQWNITLLPSLLF